MLFEDFKKSIIGDFEENTEEKKEVNKQGGGDESIKLILILILIVLTISVSIYGFTALQEYTKVEKQYQACLDKCDIASMGFSSMFEICEAECKEKYGK